MNYSDCQFNVDLGNVLNEENIEFIKCNCITNTFEKNELIFKQGTPNTHVTYVKDGFVKVLIKNSNNEFVIVNLHKSHDFIGLSSIYAGNVYCCSAIAIEQSLICFINKEIFSRLIGMNGEFANKVIEFISASENSAKKRLYNLIHKQVPGKISDLLLYFSKEIYKSNSFQLPLSRVELAEFIGTSSKSFIRTLNEFDHDKIIRINGKKIEILRNDLLHRLSMIG